MHYHSLTRRSGGSLKYNHSGFLHTYKNPSLKLKLKYSSWRQDIHSCGGGGDGVMIFSKNNGPLFHKKKASKKKKEHIHLKQQTV